MDLVTVEVVDLGFGDNIPTVIALLMVMYAVDAAFGWCLYGFKGPWLVSVLLIRSYKYILRHNYTIA